MSDDALQRTRNQFVRRWGEMGATWGISRTMAEIHALLFITGKPLCTDDVMQQLEVSRGNASMNLRQVVNWGLARRTHVRGDRKEYFISDQSAWEMFETITRERHRREVEPIIETIDDCRSDLAQAMDALDSKQKATAEEYDRRLKDIQDFISAMNALLNIVMSTGSKRIAKLLAAAGKFAQ